MSEQTFVFADLAGYTALTEAHGDEHAADVAATFCAEVRGLLNDYGAREVKSIGDALMLHAPSARDALHLGARIVGEYGFRHRALGVRVGMHTGSAIERDGDWFGSAVNVAARVADAAGRGEVLLTAATANAARVGGGELELRPMGPWKFRNVADPVEVFVLSPRGGSPTEDLPLDPVCRMGVDPRRSAHRLNHHHAELHFCSEQCRDAFAADPRRYGGG